MKNKVLAITLFTILITNGRGYAIGGESVSISNGTNHSSDVTNNSNERNIFLNNIPKEEINQFVLNGTEITLVPSNVSITGMIINNRGIFYGDTLTKAASGTKYSYFRFGILVPENSDMLGFSQGELTTLDDMPVSNTDVKYIGDFVNYDAGLQEFTRGDMDINVNFYNKTLTIEQSSEQLNKTMKGDITGNTFTFDSGKGKGQFYGSQAAEMGGVHKDHNTVTSFGAKKQ
ncbi:transferrin-binding protein-like solute binding protein [Pasteurella skyensis]|uniref:Transferrin-binding protein-like solute binding protein n=1 Tax=Phocoenobacter skyensis TaxID=97481 RepID=A0AAJ6NFN1_9PAST|nr:transferrin-binding protein-like solute binding protein [Pasteurella skyensis]MDP8171684.1 transferrin-binding protein-like solute binding protein [Pasteurella skyensis]MDP8175887.1 transferrin-binding protein-like solute binding protein [Pasteurella skyensis]